MHVLAHPACVEDQTHESSTVVLRPNQCGDLPRLAQPGVHWSCYLVKWERQACQQDLAGTLRAAKGGGSRLIAHSFDISQGHQLGCRGSWETEVLCSRIGFPRLPCTHGAMPMALRSSVIASVNPPQSLQRQNQRSGRTTWNAIL